MDNASLSAPSARAAASLNRLRPVFDFATQSSWAEHAGDPGACDFALGNPQEMPLPGFVQALQQAVVPHHKDWFAYVDNERPSREVVAASLRRTHGIDFQPDDIFMTNGAFAAIQVALAAVVDPGEEVIFNSPPWFFYEGMIAQSGATPVRVKVRPENFDLDVDAIAAAITPATRAVIVNTPNNPTGRIYPPETLTRLAEVLSLASEKHGRAIYILADEAYNRIVYDGRKFHSPTQYYPNTLLIYTYGKTLLTPGQRIGYLALPPDMPQRGDLRPAIMMTQFLSGYAFPNALLQHALPQLENLSIDIPALQRRRDRMASALSQMGYDLHVPEGTFYLMPRSPIPDDLAFIEMLAKEMVFCLPGMTFEMPGYFRISLTASDDMVERSLPGFERALAAAKAEPTRAPAPAQPRPAPAGA